MKKRKKVVDMYIYIFTLSIIAVIASSVFALLETGVVRGLLIAAAVIIFISSIIDIFLYRYFSQQNSRDMLKEAREEDFREIPPQEMRPRDR